MALDGPWTRGGWGGCGGSGGQCPVIGVETGAEKRRNLVERKC